jgi:hypothetical protein
VLDGTGNLVILILVMTLISSSSSITALAFTALRIDPAEAIKIATANLNLARKAEELATVAVWEADLGKDADEARVVYRRVVENQREAEAILALLLALK